MNNESWASQRFERLAPPFWRHILAMIYDFLLIFPLFMVSTAILLGLFGPIENINKLPVPQIVQLGTCLFILITFFGIFWCRGGQTLGMQAWRLKLVRDDNVSSITWRHSIKRVIGAMMSISVFGLGYIWRFLHPQNRYWHDAFSKTHLVLLPPTKQKKD